MSNNFVDLDFSKIRWIVILSYLVGLTLSLISIQDPVLVIIPPITLILVIFWSGKIVNRSHLITAFILGVLNDAIFQTLLGSHGLLFVVLVFLFLRIRLRFRTFSLAKQSITLSLLLYLYLLFHYIFYQPQLAGDLIFYYLAMPLTLLIVWPVINLIFNQLTNKVSDE